VMTEEAAGNSRWLFSRRESAASVRLRPTGYAVTVFVQTLFERKLVGRTGLEPADGSDLWFKAHPKEEPMNHSLVAVRHRARLGHGIAHRAKPEGRE